MTTLIELILDMAEKYEENKGKEVLSISNKIAADYINQRGEPAIDWVKSEIRKVKGLPFEGGEIPLNEDEVNHIITHISKGHLENVEELLLAELVFRGNNHSWAAFKSSSILSNLVKKFAMAQASGNEAKVGTLIELSEKDLMRLEKMSAVTFKRKRITCPNCYRVIKEWDPNKSGYDFGPRQIKCKNCDSIIPTYLIPWDKTTFEQKRKIFTFPVIMAIGGLILSLLGAEGNSYWVFFVFGLFWIFYSWRQGRVSLKVPTW